jgi:hypothetical protein
MGNLLGEIKKIPTWGWVIAAVLIGGAILVLRSKASSSTSANDATTADSTGLDATAGGLETDDSTTDALGQLIAGDVASDLAAEQAASTSTAAATPTPETIPLWAPQGQLAMTLGGGNPKVADAA